ncbi:PH domain-containing protein [Halorubrum aethiopicum]|uniref:PH domain-containing protein n=1 Tax=Halorubrum aethiopicum TaxID=1758255 RepID=UPI0008366F96|nr:PH domain-containing protein [Halorubrum aethiopicum]
MKLAPQSIPYRALQKVAGVVVVLFFVVNDTGWGFPAAAGAGLAVLLVAGAYEVAYYRRFEYELTEDTLDIRSGVISRREREIPYRRIQNVDVSRSVIQRAIGVAAVDLETAGGSSTEGSIRFVTPEEATRLQREVQRRKSADDAADGGDADSPGPVEEELFAISPRELALVGALSFDGRLIGLLAFAGSGSVPVVSGYLPDVSTLALGAVAVAAAAALFLVSWAIGAAVSFSNYYGFRLSRAGDELRYERGLFRRYSGSIPTEKVQTLTVSDNPAKRALGYATLSIETAGYAPGQGGEYGSEAAVPIATADRVYELAREIEPFGEPSFRRPPRRIRWRYAFRYALLLAVLVGVAFAVDWYVAADVPWYAPAALLLAVPPAAHLKWKHRGYWLGEDHLVTRNGFWSRSVRVVPYYRIQNVIDSRSVFQRRWNVATVVADTAGTSSLTGSDAAAVDFDVEEAMDLQSALGDRLQEALRDRRSGEGSFEWIEGDGEAGDADEADTAGGAGVADTADEADTTGESEADAEAADTSPEAPDEGVVRPDFSASTRDYSEPAERVDTGEYAVDRFPSDADVAYRPDGEEGATDAVEDAGSGDGADDGDGVDDGGGDGKGDDSGDDDADRDPDEPSGADGDSER